MQLSDFDYDLPEELIAQQPLEQRDDSRMLIVDRAAGTHEDSRFELLPGYIRAGDVVVVNNTRVFPARLLGQRDPTGGHVEVLLVREVEPATWETLLRPAHRLKPGAMIRFGDSNLRAEVLQDAASGLRVIKFVGEGPISSLLAERGQTPLPPYIRRPEGTSVADRERYQTVFASEKGAIAAPTAGLHFTPKVIAALNSRQAQVVEITLHVGYGTFEPVRVDNIEEHHVAPEFFRISETTAKEINVARSQGGRVIAVGTTTTRALESAVNAEGQIEPTAGETNLTITPGFKFRAVDALLTNFHLPCSSLLLLVSAFAGRELTLAAYRHAVAARFRFYSYGDCMLVI
ncbi:MAG TPA: tRNA preQ1(34) S-adenosylmethionine ribosyltransferase-isomerase QueA [Pyrinomonadaceae bacterium]|jgi:S-adenosylmethionine:tRNA ribosyltransferase-isomerase|nr:tRNA preQ1(34) S-adenosylmethionine ribosyltransferase-isomerase QueA [Pyrinomonadaceae bacterium]